MQEKLWYMYMYNNLFSKFSTCNYFFQTHAETFCWNHKILLCTYFYQYFAWFKYSVAYFKVYIPLLVYALGGRSYGRTKVFCPASFTLLEHLNTAFSTCNFNARWINQRFQNFLNCHHPVIDNQNDISHSLLS